MQEFESISASSYDPSALATKLTAKAGEGWSVVAIVPTGGDVTAFLTRDTNSASEASRPAETTAPEANTDDEDTTSPAIAAETESVEGSVAAETQSEQAEPVSEPSGWAIAPDSTTPKTPEPEAVAATTPVAAAATRTPDAAQAPSVPAGWYADPAGRFELRYWDGNAWTEHVSRAGQQFTDPPVA